MTSAEAAQGFSLEGRGKRNLTAIFFFFLFTAYPVFSKAKTVAVLPFENLSRSRELSALHRGIAETLSFCLAQSPKIRVMERGQLNRLLQEKALQEAFSRKDFQAIEGVDLLILGSFQKIKKKLLIVARAVDLDSGEVKASEAVSGRANEIVSLLRQLATKILRALGDQQTSVIIPYEDKSWTAKTFELLMKAFDFYQKGQKPKAIQLWRKIERKVPFVKEAVIWLSGSLKGFQKGYTGLVVDCRHLKLERSPFPLIFSGKDVLYGHRIKGNEDLLLFTGLVSYPETLAEAKKRAGPHPLVVKARRVVRVSNVPKGVMLSRKDAEKVKRENRKSHFLENYRVAFLVGKKRD